MTEPRTVEGDELKRIRQQFKSNSEADVVEHPILVRFTRDHVLVEIAGEKETALLFSISKRAV